VSNKEFPKYVVNEKLSEAIKIDEEDWSYWRECAENLDHIQAEKRKQHSWKKQLREKHLEWLKNELNNLDFGADCDRDKLLFAIGSLVLELLNEKRDYGDIS